MMEATARNPNPLEDDDEGHLPLERSSDATFRTMLRIGVFALALSFIAALIGAVIENNATGDRDLEGVAFSLNRYGMLAMLISCIVVFVAFRGPRFANYFQNSSARQHRSFNWIRMLFLNVIALVGFLAIAVPLGSVSLWMSSLFALAIIPTLVSLIVTIAIWHHGLVRAYAIGFLVAALLILCFAFSWFSVLMSALAVSGPNGRMGLSPILFQIARLSYQLSFSLACRRCRA